MVVRIWIVLVALLLVAAPATDVSAEIVDEQVSVAGEDVEVLHATVPEILSRCCAPARSEHEAWVPVAPVLAGVFRPPRCTFE